ncbi:hypothetical protein CS022_21425 [Veronia nyctiphanis]|uniref:Uncharacterized protein n=1 Tax=Veronia nyctiphanis TaxID=1278244 RepID=A0A4Q0YKQ3_9GAMM|nr:hypothetical protein CS022_21425 [Veronia nyctiphanis]
MVNIKSEFRLLAISWPKRRALANKNRAMFLTAECLICAYDFILLFSNLYFIKNKLVEVGK